MSVLLATNVGDIVIDFDEFDQTNSPAELPLVKALKHFIAACESKSLNNIKAEVDENEIIRFGDNNNNNSSEQQQENGKASINVNSGDVFVIINDSLSSSTSSITFLIIASNNEQSILLPPDAVKIGQVMEGLTVCQSIIRSINKSPSISIFITDVAILFDLFIPIPSAAEFEDAERRSQVLELLGDLPSSSTKPKDNILFLCKLNPITQSDDLKIIFSRFGKIIDCRVVEDKITKKSLCYAFIEFENSSQCEAAYIKMNNSIIDDRQVVVDFSQSTSKEKYQQRKEEEKQRNHKETNGSEYNNNNNNHNEKYRESNYRDRDSGRRKESSTRHNESENDRGNHKDYRSDDRNRDRENPRESRSSRHRSDRRSRSRSPRRSSDRYRSHSPSPHRHRHQSHHHRSNR